jgi:hypothetical protein
VVVWADDGGHGKRDRQPVLFLAVLEVFTPPLVSKGAKKRSHSPADADKGRLRFCRQF